MKAASNSISKHRLAPPPPTRWSLPRVVRVPWKGPVLHAGPFADHPDVLGLNIAQGCAHRCAFCSARAYPSYPGDDVLYLYQGTAELLAEELAGRKHKPRAVYISPSTDPFMPLVEVQEETARIVEVLAEHDVAAWLMTRGWIRPSAQAVLARHADRVKVTLGLTTMNRPLHRILEPLAAPPRLRLRQVAHLRDLGIAVHVALEPLIPGLTDTSDNLAPLLEALALAGVRQVSASYMFLRSGIRDNLAAALEPGGWKDLVLDEYKNGPVMPAGSIAPARYLPKARRQRGYATLTALAARVGIKVSVSALTNPDFWTPVPAAEPAPRQRLLPMW